MQGHKHYGKVPLHGCKVAIGSLASTLLYEQLLEVPLESLDTARMCRNWHDEQDLPAMVEQTHRLPALRRLALRECRKKYVNRRELADRLELLKAVWPDLRERLREQILPLQEMRGMLRLAGAPTVPSQIGIELSRLRRGYHEAWQIRSRYTVLDLATETGLLSTCLDRIFADDRSWNAGSTLDT
jgi:glycerol-1-phosphate dehydrogenase [NAD(P)+]